MGLKEILKKQGYTDEQIKEVLNAMKENGIYTSTVENPEETIKKLQEEKETLQSDKSENTAGSDEVKKLKEIIQKEKRDTAMIIALTKAQAADVDYLMYLAEKSGELDRVKVDENGAVSGTAELVQSLKQNYAGQFLAAEKQQEEKMIRTGVKKLDNQSEAAPEPQTLEEAITQKLSGENE